MHKDKGKFVINLGLKEGLMICSFLVFNDVIVYGCSEPTLFQEFTKQIIRASTKKKKSRRKKKENTSELSICRSFRTQVYQ